VMNAGRRGDKEEETQMGTKPGKSEQVDSSSSPDYSSSNNDDTMVACACASSE